MELKVTSVKQAKRANSVLFLLLIHGSTPLSLYRHVKEGTRQSKGNFSDVGRKYSKYFLDL